MKKIPSASNRNTDLMRESATWIGNLNMREEESWREMSNSAFDRKNFTPQEYIEGLTRKLVARDSLDISQPFSSREYLNLFRKELVHLQVGLKQLGDKVNATEKRGKEVEQEHKDKLYRLSLEYSQTFEELKLLDGRIHKVGNTAVRIGERLESIDAQKIRARETASLIEEFIRLNVENPDLSISADEITSITRKIKLLNNIVPELGLGGSFSNPSPTPTTVSTHQSVANANASVTSEQPPSESSKSLNSITNISCSNTEFGKKAVEALSSKLENFLLEKFEHAADQRNYDAMKECAELLFEFNGGDSCIQRYITKMDMFFSVTSLNKDHELSCYHLKVGSVGEKFEDIRLREFYDKILRTYKQEYDVIQYVFINPNFVISQLIQRICEQRVRGFLESIICQDESDRYYYLRVLYNAYTQTQKHLVEGLKRLNAISSNSNIMSDKNNKNSDNKQRNSDESNSNNNIVLEHDQDSNSVPIGNIYLDFNFDSLIESLFCYYRETYAEYELAYIRDVCQEAVTSYLESEKKVSHKENGHAEYSGINMDNSALMSVEMILDLIHTCEEAIERCYVLSPVGTLPANLCAIFEILLSSVSDSILFDVLVKTSKLIGSASENQPRFMNCAARFLSIVQLVNQAVLLLQRHLYKWILPKIDSSPKDGTSCIESFEKTLSKLEDLVENGLQNMLHSAITLIEKILVEQKKTDFKFKEIDETSFAMDPENQKSTIVCQKIVGFLSEQHKLILCYLDGLNLDRYMAEMGVRLGNVLLDHFKKYVVSVGLGGLKLMRELSEYRDAAAKFKIKEVDEKFALINELSKLHLVSPDSFRSVIEESRLSKLDRTEILAYLKTRSDFKLTWNQNCI